MQPRAVTKLAVGEESFRTKQARELHQLLLKSIHSDKPSNFHWEIDTKLEALQKDPETLKEKSRVGFTYLADILHLPYLLYRDKNAAWERAERLFTQFKKWVKTPDLLNYFLMQKSYGAYNILHIVIDADDARILSLFLNYLTEAKKNNILSLNDLANLIKEEEIFHGNNAFHLITRKNNVENVKIFINWFNEVFGREISAGLLQNVLNHRNKAGFKPWSKHQEVRDILGQYRGLDQEKLREQELNQVIQGFQIELEEKERELRMNLRHAKDLEEYLHKQESQSAHDKNYIRGLEDELDKARRALEAAQRGQAALYDEMRAENFDLRARNSGLEDEAQALSKRLRYVAEDLQETQVGQQALKIELTMAQERIRQLEAQLLVAKESELSLQKTVEAYKETRNKAQQEYPSYDSHKKEIKPKKEKHKHDKRDQSPLSAAHAEGGAGMWRHEDRKSHATHGDERRHHHKHKSHR